MQATDINTIRELNEDGIKKFSHYLNKERVFRNKDNGYNSETDPPYELLDNDRYSNDFVVEQETFDVTEAIKDFLTADPLSQKKRHYINPLIDIFRGTKIKDLRNQIGLWSGLSLLFFNQLQPGKNHISNSDLYEKATASGLNHSNICTISKDEHYILGAKGSSGFKTRYHHRIYSAFIMKKDLGYMPDFMLNSPAYVWGDVFEIIFGFNMNNNTELLKIADKFYSDKNTYTGRKEYSIKREHAGSLPRFQIFLKNQLPLNYQVDKMTQDQLLEIISDNPEFESWIN